MSMSDDYGDMYESNSPDAMDLDESSHPPSPTRLNTQRPSTRTPTDPPNVQASNLSVQTRLGQFETLTQSRGHPRDDLQWAPDSAPPSPRFTCLFHTQDETAAEHAPTRGDVTSQDLTGFKAETRRRTATPNTALSRGQWINPDERDGLVDPASFATTSSAGHKRFHSGSDKSSVEKNGGQETETKHARSEIKSKTSEANRHPIRRRRKDCDICDSQGCEECLRPQLSTGEEDEEQQVQEGCGEQDQWGDDSYYYDYHEEGADEEEAKNDDQGVLQSKDAPIEAQRYHDKEEGEVSDDEMMRDVQDNDVEEGPTNDLTNTEQRHPEYSMYDDEYYPENYRIGQAAIQEAEQVSAQAPAPGTWQDTTSPHSEQPSQNERTTTSLAGGVCGRGRGRGRGRVSRGRGGRCSRKDSTDRGQSSRRSGR